MNDNDDGKVYDVIIGGGGPVGLMLACELGLAGRCKDEGGLSVLVLERDDPDATAGEPWKTLPLGIRGLKRLGKKKWQRHVAKVANQLRAALQADYVVLGGGNAKKLKTIPPHCRLGNNRNAFKGGMRLWDTGRLAGK